MVHRPTDFFIRRTGKLYFKIDDVLNYKDQVIDVMAELLGYTDIQKTCLQKNFKLQLMKHKQVIINLQLKNKLNIVRI